MKIESTRVDVNASQEDIYSFLVNSNNLIHLLPQDKISNWKSTENECSFKAQGGFLISLLQNGNQGKSKVFMKSGEKSPFPFKLTLFINEKNDKSNGYIEFEGNVNLFLKKIVEKPLTELFNHMAIKLQEHFKQ
jgi:hypothetical protein